MQGAFIARRSTHGAGDKSYLHREKAVKRSIRCERKQVESVAQASSVGDAGMREKELG